jgi:site-specific recombinase XerD
MVSYVVNAVLAEVLGDRRRPGMGPHTLRHTFATLAARDGTGMRVLQELLGHADLSTTQRYVHVASEQLTAALTSHPLADAG